ncbi:MAG TPA: tyrosine protein phosphatase [Desulfobulbaceae bacterium]|nr:tyrosine protein phosphatase [Desulfobulbaceae bacterium]
MIDIHCHILPGIDDGPQTLATSLAMAKMAERDGIRTLIATPHTDGIRVNRVRVEAAVHDLNLELQRLNMTLSVCPGYEIPYHLAEELSAAHTLANNGRHVLIEFPPMHLPKGALNTFFTLIAAGLVPVLAHPERNLGVLINPDVLKEMVDNGVLVQITATSITGELGPDVQRCAHHLLKQGWVHFLATDSHSPTFREPVLGRAVTLAARLIGQENAMALVEQNPRQILAAAESLSASTS